jgi:RNA polymerase-binding protein DksA
MTEKDLNQLKSALLRRRREIIERLEDQESGRQALSEPESEMVEEGQKAVMTHLYESLDQQERGRIEEIDLALSRIAEGTYGSCEVCGKVIPLERLRAVPATRYCVNCSLEREVR